MVKTELMMKFSCSLNTGPSFLQLSSLSVEMLSPLLGGVLYWNSTIKESTLAFEIFVWCTSEIWKWSDFGLKNTSIILQMKTDTGRWNNFWGLQIFLLYKVLDAQTFLFPPNRNETFKILHFQHLPKLKISRKLQISF